MNLFFVLTASLFARAALIPSEYLAKKITDRRNDIPQLVLQTQVELGGSKMATQCLVQLKDREWRCQFFAAPQTEIYRFVRKLRGTTPPLAAFLFESELPHLESLLQRIKVPVKTEQQLLQFKSEKQRREVDTVRLKRTEFGVVWAMSGDSADLWIERYTFHPLRLTFTSGEVGPIQADFSKPQIFRSFAFPQELKVTFEGQTLTEKLVRYSPASPKFQKEAEAWTSGPTAAFEASGLRALVETYLKVLR